MLLRFLLTRQKFSALCFEARLEKKNLKKGDEKTNLGCYTLLKFPSPFSLLLIISIKISFSSRGKNERFFRQTIPSLQFRTEHLHTHKRPSVSSPEKMEQTLLLAGRRHASFLCSSSSLSLSKKVKKNRGGGGGALLSRFIFLTTIFPNHRILSHISR